MINSKIKLLVLPFSFLLMGSNYSDAQTIAVKKVDAAMSAIASGYVDKVDENQMADEDIKLMLSKLDPHSVYISKKEVNQAENPLQGNFVGIGIQFMLLSDTLYVSQVTAGGPAQKAGMLAGDRILTIDGTNIAGVHTVNGYVISRIVGPKNTVVNLKVLRNKVKDPLALQVTRASVQIPSIQAAYMEDKETGYIAIARFAITTHAEFLEAFNALKKKGMKNLILDLQGNGGGFLGAGIETATEFLNKDQLIVCMKGANIKQNNIKAEKNGVFNKGKLVVLINESTASASEVVSGALQDWDRAVLVGRRSYGKGLVQKPVLLPDSSMIRLTVARYFTPSGRNIQKPYEKGNFAAYKDDLNHRFSNGEYVNADKIHFADSLKFKTLINQRTVYGGGGIMPDCFVPSDTSYYSKWYSYVITRGLMNRIAVEMAIKNGDQLKAAYPDFNSFYKNYSVSEKTLENLIHASDADQIPFNEADYNKSKKSIETELKAIIARTVWSSDEYYIRVINKADAAYGKAMELMTKPALYNNLLIRNKA